MEPRVPHAVSAPPVAADPSCPSSTARFCASLGGGSWFLPGVSTTELPMAAPAALVCASRMGERGAWLPLANLKESALHRSAPDRGPAVPLSVLPGACQRTRAAHVCATALVCVAEGVARLAIRVSAT